MSKPNSARLQNRPRGGAVLIGFAVVLILAFSWVGPYTQYLWFKQDAEYTRVFTLQYTARATLFGLSLFPLWAWISFGLKQATGFALIFSEAPTGPQRGLILAVQSIKNAVYRSRVYIALLFAGLISFGLAGQWQLFLLALHGGSFGRTDPLFGWDYSLYVFRLPWWAEVVDVINGVVLPMALLHLAIYFGMTALKQVTPLEVEKGRLARQASGWVGCAFLGLALSAALACLSFGTRPSGQFVGPGLAGMWALRANEALVVVLVLVGVLCAITRKLSWALGGGIASAAVALVGGALIPDLVQRFAVEPDKLNVEAPYADRAIAATRFGYDLESIKNQPMNVAAEPTAQEVASAQSTFDNLRLWDPRVLREAIGQLQGLKPYYMFHDVDIDRYWLPDANGTKQETSVMISPRDIFTQGLSVSSQTWVNTQLTYTHGYGIVVSPVHGANAMGQPASLVHDIPIQASPGFDISRPQTYFSHYLDGQGGEEDPYAIVNTRLDEFDYPTQTGSASSRWSGKGGVAIDPILTRLAFSIVEGDGNLLISSKNLTEGSRLLLHRNILARAQMLYPFLSFDADPYIVNINGGLVWLLDGYTTSDRLPYSTMEEFRDAPVNYIRNSVKVSIDAYSGKMEAYAVRQDDPILNAYRGIYPGLVQAASAAPAELKAHFRYPEQLFDLQTKVLCTYHVTNPRTFLSNGDGWSLPFERGLGGNSTLSPPYYIQMRLPDAPTDEFLLMRGFTPFQRDNMSGWLAAHCDGDSYGKLTLYTFEKGETIPGPAQVESLFVQDSRISEVNRQLNNDQSEIIVGNLLTVPVGNSMVYAESLFLRNKSASSGIPELRKVILAVKDRIAIGDNYAEAYTRLFGTAPSIDAGKISSPAENGPPSHTGPPLSPKDQELQAISQLLDQADAALRKGDFASYGQLQKKARTQLHALLSLGNQTAKPGQAPGRTSP